MKTLRHYLEKRHTRYITEEALAELKSRTATCDSSATPPERLFWLLEGLTEYPKCRACAKRLSSFYWEPFLKPELRQAEHKDRKSGYRPFCCRECSYNFEGLKKAKYQKTSLQRFGVEHPMKSREVVEKIRATNLANTGESWPLRWGSEKHAQKLHERFGVTTARHLPGVHEKTIESIAEKSTQLFQHKIVEIEQQLEVTCLTDFTTQKIYNQQRVELSWQHKCGYVYSSKIGTGGSICVCPECFISRSKAEQDLGDYLESLGVEIIRNDRQIIKPRELDIYIPSLRLAIEFDGTYWHSAKFQSRVQSVEKLQLCEKLGIKLITVQEGYWNRNRDVVKSRLNSALGLSSRIFARNCEIEKITQDDGAKFLKLNHLQGSARAKHYYGLKFESELVAVMSFGPPRWRRSEQHELIRFASKMNCSVVGGASKLLKRFRKDFPGRIISYADRCWSSGNLYKSLGFKYSHESAPSYWWVSEKLGIYSRYQTQKSKLQKLLTEAGCEFEQTLSEAENMKLNGFLQVFDRGNSVWILN